MMGMHLADPTANVYNQLGNLIIYSYLALLWACSFF